MPKSNVRPSSSISRSGLALLDRLTFELGDAAYELAATLAKRRGSVNAKTREIEIDLSDVQEAAHIIAQAVRCGLEPIDAPNAVSHVEPFVGAEVEQCP